MDSFFKNLKDKLSVDNFVNMVKDSSIGQSINNEEVSDTFQKLDPRNITTDDITKTMSEITEKSMQVIEEVGKTVTEEASIIKEVATVVEVAKSVDAGAIVEVAKAGYNILKKSSNEPILTSNTNKDEPLPKNTSLKNDIDDLDPIWDI